MKLLLCLLLVGVALAIPEDEPMGGAEKCGENKEWSPAFNKCLPKQGHDGMITGSGKDKSNLVFAQPWRAETMQPFSHSAVAPNFQPIVQPLMSTAVPIARVAALQARPGQFGGPLTGGPGFMPVAGGGQDEFGGPTFGPPGALHGAFRGRMFHGGCPMHQRMFGRFRSRPNLHVPVLVLMPIRANIKMNQFLGEGGRACTCGDIKTGEDKEDAIERGPAPPTAIDDPRMGGDKAQAVKNLPKKDEEEDEFEAKPRAKPILRQEEAFGDEDNEPRRKPIPREEKKGKIEGDEEPPKRGRLEKQPGKQDIEAEEF